MANADEPVTPCPELPRVHALADGELHGLEAARVRRHARRCAECRAELALLRWLAVAVAVVVAAGLLPEVLLPEAIAAIAAIDPIDRLS